MSGLEFQRARQPEQKQQRRADILQSAVEMLEEEGIDGVSLNALARRVGLAKSNMYRYFESREAILLELLRADFHAWADELEAGLGKIRGKRKVDKVAKLVGSSCAARPRMCQLIGALSSVLEQNLSAETVHAFKLDALDLGARLAQALHQALPELGQAESLQLVRYTHSLISGLWPAANPPPVVAQVMEDPVLAPFKHDFEADVEQGVRLLALGLMR